MYLMHVCNWGYPRFCSLIDDRETGEKCQSSFVRCIGRAWIHLSIPRRVTALLGWWTQRWRDPLPHCRSDSWVLARGWRHCVARGTWCWPRRYWTSGQQLPCNMVHVRDIHWKLSLHLLMVFTNSKNVNKVFN